MTYTLHFVSAQAAPPDIAVPCLLELLTVLPQVGRMGAVLP